MLTIKDRREALEENIGILIHKISEASQKIRAAEKAVNERETLRQQLLECICEYAALNREEDSNLFERFMYLIKK